LRAIQERVIDRIGGTAPVKIDIRLVATSNRDMQAAVKAGQFREDLYFRLNVVNLELPSLKERPSDIPALAAMFADKYSEHNGIVPKKLSDAAIQKLQAHSWPGNVRELENAMHRAVLISQDAEIEPNAIMLSGQKTTEILQAATIKAADPAPEQPGGDVPAALVGRTVAEVERELILNTLDHCLGNRTHAANILGISIRTLRNKLKEYNESGIPVPSTGSSSA
jgi:DNA-binding NtrC family response regulator